MTLLSCFKIYYKLESTAIIAKLTMFIALISLYDELSLLASYINKLMKVFQAYKIIFIGFLEIVFCTKKRKLSGFMIGAIFSRRHQKIYGSPPTFDANSL